MNGEAIEVVKMTDMMEVMAFSPGGPPIPQQNGANGSAASSNGGRGGRVKHHRHEDQEEGKLFVGGLSWETTQDTLLRYFSRYGDVIDCVVMKNAETGRSRGFGFVTFSDPNNIDGVVQSSPHTLDGRTIDPKPCNPRSMQKPRKNTNWPKVFLGGLPSSITETDLRSFFSRYGRVTEVVIMYDQEKKKARGFGFLSFETDAAVEQAVSEHYVNIQNKQVEIKRAEPRNTPAESLTNGPVVDQWGVPPTNGISHTPATPNYGGWGAPPVPPQATPAPQTINYGAHQQQPTPNHWGAPPQSQPSPVSHNWGAPPGQPPPQQNSYAPPQQPQAPPQFAPSPYVAQQTPAPQHTFGTSYWGSPPGPTPPPSTLSTPGDLYINHAAPPQSPPNSYNSQPGFQLQTAPQPPNDYSRMYATKPAPPAPHHPPPTHYSSPTSPDYYGTPQPAPVPTYPPSDSSLGLHRPNHVPAFAAAPPVPSQPYHTYRRS